jgi:hypothetical protein
MTKIDAKTSPFIVMGWKRDLKAGIEKRERERMDEGKKKDKRRTAKSRISMQR